MSMSLDGSGSATSSSDQPRPANIDDVKAAWALSNAVYEYCDKMADAVAQRSAAYPLTDHIVTPAEWAGYRDSSADYNQRQDRETLEVFAAGKLRARKARIAVEEVLGNERNIGPASCRFVFEPLSAYFRVSEPKLETSRLQSLG
jgi:hypothetical protein